MRRSSKIIRTTPRIPSQLPLGWEPDRPIHLVVAYDAGTLLTIVITVYGPEHVVPRLHETKKSVRCAICKVGETRAGHVTVTLERGEATVIIKRVPALVCDNCGEEYVDETVAADLLRNARNASDASIQLEVREYSAAAPTG